jgi:hypothetical protein
MSIGAFVMTIGVISLILIWLFQSLKKDVDRKKRKIGIVPLVLVSSFAIAGFSLLMIKNSFGYLFLVAGLIACVIIENKSLPIIVSLLCMIFGVSFIRSERIVGASLIVLSVLFWIYLWIAPILKENDKKAKIKVLVPTIFALLFLIGGLVIMCYVSFKIDGLPYCWGV